MAVEFWSDYTSTKCTIFTGMRGVTVFLIAMTVGVLLIWGSYTYVDDQSGILEYIPIIMKTKSRIKRRNITEHLLRACEELVVRNVSQMLDAYKFNKSKWLVGERFKILACKNLKVGSRNIARTIYTLDHLSEQTDPSEIGDEEAKHAAILHKINKTNDNWENRFKNYTKFMFVRDPIERLLSAYRDRRPGVFFKSNKKGTFEVFLEWLLKLSDNEVNPHLVSFTRMCNPCGIKYDFIGLMDNYEEDMSVFLESIGVAKYVSVPHRNQTGFMKNKSAEVLQAYLQQLPEDLIKRIYEKYYWDYFLFGFSKPKF